MLYNVLKYERNRIVFQKYLTNITHHIDATIYVLNIVSFKFKSHKNTDSNNSFLY